MNGIRRKLVAAIVTIGASATAWTGGGMAHAAPPAPPIVPGHYVFHTWGGGFIPSPEANVMIVGNRFEQDAAGMGPQNFTTWIISPMPGGATVQFGVDSVSQWLQHYELHPTPTGYAGTIYTYGEIPVGNITLTRTERRANQPR